MDYKIEKDVPIPDGRTSKYPFKDMEVGDSFIIYQEYSRENMWRAGNAARNWATKRGFDRKFKVKKTEDNKIRIWRIK